MSEQQAVVTTDNTEVLVPENKQENTSHHDVRNIIISCLSKFISGYSLNVINIVVEILESLYGSELVNENSKGLMSSASLIGCVTGQLVIGYLGDYLGRKAALVITVAFNIIGCLGSAFAFEMGPISIVTALIFWRFVMGFGIGGTYPLSAVMGTESASEGKKEWTGAFVFTFHGLGWFVSPGLAYLLLQFWPDGKEYIWRILLFISAIPAIIIAFIRSSETGVVMKDHKKGDQPSIWKLMANKDIMKKMIGTGGAWFIFDINLYGQALFSTTVVDLICGKSDPIVQAEFMTLFNLLGYVGCIVSIFAVNWWGIKILQIQGFICRSLLFIIMGACLSSKFMNAPILLTLYSIIFFYGNFGPNTTTFLLPAVTYDVEVRSTLNGVSAALGKFGASIGAYAYEAIAKYIGEDVVMYIAGALAMIACLLTYFFIPREVDNEIFENKRQKQLKKQQMKEEKQRLLDAEQPVIVDTIAVSTQTN